MTSPPPSARPRWTLAAVAVSLFCVQIDYFAMNLALPRMASELGGSVTDLQWVISVYLLALGAFMVPAGRIGDIFGRRRALLAGIALFGLASVACALAPSAPVLIGSRAVQGLGAALIFPVSVSVLTNVFPAARAAQAIGLAYAIAGLGNAAGPLIGGLLTQTVGWRSLFWLNVPLTAVAFAIAAATVTESRDPTVPRRIDVAGLALITAGIGVFTLSFDRAPVWGWLAPATVGLFAAAVAALVAFVVVERATSVPLVDHALARNRPFVVLVVAGTIANVAYGVTIFLSTMFLQDVRGLDPLTAGLAFLGPSVGAALGGALAGRLAQRFPPVLVMGLACTGAAIALAALAASNGWPGYLTALSAAGLTLGLVYAFTTVATQAVVRPERAGEAAGVTLTFLITLGGVGVALAGTGIELLQRGGLSAGGAIQAVFAGLAAVLLPAGLVVMLLARRRAEPQP